MKVVVVNFNNDAGFAKSLRDDFFAEGTVDEKTTGELSGVEPELAADRLFDFRYRAAIVLRQLCY